MHQSIEIWHLVQTVCLGEEWLGKKCLEELSREELLSGKNKFSVTGIRFILTRGNLCILFFILTCIVLLLSYEGDQSGLLIWPRPHILKVPILVTIIMKCYSKINVRVVVEKFKMVFFWEHIYKLKSHVVFRNVIWRDKSHLYAKKITWKDCLGTFWIIGCLWQ